MLRTAVPALVVLGCGSPQAHHHQHHHGHHGGPLVHRFEKADEWASVFDDPTRDVWQKPPRVVELMKIEPGSTVVDLGAGTGYFLPHLSKAVGDSGKVIALDVEPDMVRYMKERAAREKLANVEPRVAPGDAPGLAAASVDRILIVDTWHHIPERAAYAKKLREALRPNGAVYIVDYTKDADRGPPKEHRLTPEQVIEELAAGGLHARVVSEDLPDQYVIAATL